MVIQTICGIEVDTRNEDVKAELRHKQKNLVNRLNRQINGIKKEYRKRGITNPDDGRLTKLGRLKSSVEQSGSAGNVKSLDEWRQKLDQLKRRI